MMQRLRVGIFGGSFNPPHNGHVEICRRLLKKSDVDRIWIVPCFNHPFGKEMTPFDARLYMCKFAFGEFGDKVVVSDVERKLGDVSHTVKTIEYLQAHYPDHNFSLIMGGDTMEEVDTWKDADRIKELVRLIAIPRGPNSPIPNISSTDVRVRIKNGRNFSELVPRDVAVYIITHGLYSD